VQEIERRAEKWRLAPLQIRPLEANFRLQLAECSALKGHVRRRLEFEILSPINKSRRRRGDAPGSLAY
jgi:hypothetical protein